MSVLINRRQAHITYGTNKEYILISQKEPTRCNRVVEFIIPMFLNCSTCFGRHTAHHQELKNCNCSLWFYVRLWLPVAEMAEPWWWAVCRPKHVEQLRNIGIINSTTRLHLVGSFCEMYITMHGSMNIMSVFINRTSKALNNLHFEFSDTMTVANIINDIRWSVKNFEQFMLVC